MSDSRETFGITQVATVFVPVADQDRALAFYVEKLGFEKRVDFQYGGTSRWLEVGPPGSAINLALVPPSEGRSSGTGETHCAWTVVNIEAVHAALRAKDVDVDLEIASAGKRRPGLISTDASIADPVPPQFFIRDLDGTRFLLVEPPAK
jgi:catechol 2,3-dioxygenase-like lactoylglutathione lyase family enzyme